MFTNPAKYTIWTKTTHGPFIKLYYLNDQPVVSGRKVARVLVPFDMWPVVAALRNYFRTILPLLMAAQLADCYTVFSHTLVFLLYTSEAKILWLVFCRRISDFLSDSLRIISVVQFECLNYLESDLEHKYILLKYSPRSKCKHYHASSLHVDIATCSLYIQTYSCSNFGQMWAEITCKLAYITFA